MSPSQPFSQPRGSSQPAEGSAAMVLCLFIWITQGHAKSTQLAFKNVWLCFGQASRCWRRHVVHSESFRPPRSLACAGGFWSLVPALDDCASPLEAGPLHGKPELLRARVLPSIPVTMAAPSLTLS